MSVIGMSDDEDFSYVKRKLCANKTEEACDEFIKKCNKKIEVAQLQEANLDEEVKAQEEQNKKLKELAAAILDNDDE